MGNYFQKIIVLFVGLIFFSITGINAQVKIKYVDASSGNDSSGVGSFSAPYKTIQKAIDSAKIGDTVLLKRGTYLEKVDLKGKISLLSSLYVISRDTADITQTIISGVNNGNTNLIVNSGTKSISSYHIYGLTIKDVRLQVVNLSAGNEAYEFKLSKSVITNSGVYGQYGVIGIGNHGILDSCKIYNNKGQFIISSAEYGSPGPIISNNTCFNNTASASGTLYEEASVVHVEGTNKAKILNNLIYKNFTTGINFGGNGGDSMIFVNNTVALNKGYGIRFHTYGGVYSGILINNISKFNSQLDISCNTVINGPGTYIKNNFFGNSGSLYNTGIVSVNNTLLDTTGNIGGDPLFKDTLNNNYRLKPNSTAIGAGFKSNYLLATDIEGKNRINSGRSNPDIGAYESENTSNAYTNYHLKIKYVDVANGNDSSGVGSFSSPYKTIQKAIDSAKIGDTVLLKRGTYLEKVDLKGKISLLSSLYVISNDTADISQTIISGANNGNITLITNTGTKSISSYHIYALTIKDVRLLAISLAPGNEIYKIKLSKSIISNSGTYGQWGVVGVDNNGILDSCKIFGNKGRYIISVTGRAGSTGPIVSNNTFYNNSSSSDGSAFEEASVIFADCGSKPRVINNLIFKNNTSGIQFGGNGSDSMIVVNNTVTLNKGYGIRYVTYGGVYSGILINNISKFNSQFDISCNTAINGPGIYIKNNFFGNNGKLFNTGIISENNTILDTTGNIGGDPLFIDTLNNNYRLKSSSTAIGAGFKSNYLLATDIEGKNRINSGRSKPDIGAFESEYLSNTSHNFKIYVDSIGNDTNSIGLIGAPFKNIKSAIDYSLNGDTILVGKGTYFENLDFGDKQIHLISINGPLSSIIDGNNNGMGLVIRSTNASFEGFSVRNTAAPKYQIRWVTSYGFHVTGTGIFSGDQSQKPLIKNCLIYNNDIGVYGNARMLNCKVYNNLSGYVGYWVSPQIDRCIFYGNTQNAINISNAANSKIDNSLFYGNQQVLALRSDLNAWGFPVMISNSTITGNSNILSTSEGNKITIANSIIYGNTNPVLNFGQTYDSLFIKFSIIEGGVQVIPSSVRGKMIYDSSNLTSNPLFLGANDFRLQIGSPAIGKASLLYNSGYDILDSIRPNPKGSNPDIGAYESEFKYSATNIIFKSPNLLFPLNNITKLDTSIKFSWNKIDKATRYIIQYASDSIFTKNLYQFSAIDTSINLGNFKNNSDYFWRVQATDSVNIGTWSKYFTFQTFIQKPKLDSVKSILKTLTLNWSNVDTTKIKYVKIYRDTSILPSKLIDSISGKFLQYNDKLNIQSNQKYYYRLTSVNYTLIESDYSNVLSGSTSNTLPKAINLIDKEIKNVGEYNFVKLSFSASGSKDLDGTISKYLWYVNDSLVNQTDSVISYFFKLGTNKIKLVVVDNDNGRDSSIATIRLSSLSKIFKGGILGGISALNQNTIITADATYDPILGSSIVVLNRFANTTLSLNVQSKIFTTPSISTDSLIFITNGSNLNGYSKAGVALWSTIPLGGISYVTPTIDSTLGRIYLGVSNKNFFAYDYKTGKNIWNYLCDAPVNTSAVITLDRKLIFTSQSGTLYGFDISKSDVQTTPKWKVVFGDLVLKSPAVDANNDIYVGTDAGRFIKFKLNNDGSILVKWNITLSASIQSSPVIDADGYVYIGNEKGDFYKIDPISGKVLWTYNVNASIRSTPSISEFGVIYVATTKGDIFAINADKVVKWKYSDSSSISANILYIKNMLYFANENGLLTGIYDNPNSITVNTSFSSIQTNHIFNNRVNSFASNNNYFNNSLFDFYSSSKNNQNYVSDFIEQSALIERKPIWGTFQGDYRRSGSLSVECPQNLTISKDEKGNLVSSYPYKIGWYKNGSILSGIDSNLYKPTESANYSIKSNIVGCESIISQSYYYLITDVINISSDEFIKLVPNPFINQLNFDFVIKGYEKLNIEIFDLATGSRKASMQNLTPGLPIYLGQLSAGTYFIKVSSNDGKINYQFKMIKL